MSVTLTTKGAKLVKLYDAFGFDTMEEMLSAAITDAVCPAICLTEGCDYTPRSKSSLRTTTRAASTISAASSLLVENSSGRSVSHDPADPELTTRVLTLMLADEY